MPGYALLLACLFALAHSSLAVVKGEKNQSPVPTSRYPSEYRKNPCANPKVVKTFHEKFEKAVDKCEQLSSIFKGMKRVTSDEFNAGAFYVSAVYKVLAKFKHPIQESAKLVEVMARNCEKLEPKVITSFYANAAGQVLNENKKLNSKNAGKLADELSTSLKKVAKNIAGDSPRSQVTSLVLGYLNFEKQQKVLEENVSYKFVRNEWKCQIKNNKSSKKCPIANFSPAKTFLKQSDSVCKIKSKAIDTFASTFRDQVRKCKTLTNLFNVRPDITPDMMARGSYYVSLYFLGQAGADNPRELADFMSRFIRDVKPLKICQLEQVHGRFVAKYLESAKMLNCKNAKTLAVELAEAMRKTAREVVDNKIPRSKVIGIQLGWRSFLKSHKLLTKESAPKRAYLYGNEWRCQAKEWKD